MDAKITKKRLGIMLSYDWIKIIAVCAAAVVLWALIFQMTATRPTMGQEMGVYVYPGTALTDKVGNFDSLKKKGALSYDVLTYGVNSYASRNDAATVLAAHIPAGSADIMFSCDTDTYNDKGELKEASGLKTFLASYHGACVWLGEAGATVAGYTYSSNYFLDCENYLKRFFGEDFAASPLNESAAESHFRTRMKKDKRFKTEKQIAESAEQEFARLNRLRGDYIKLKNWLADGTVGLRTVEIPTGKKDESGKEETVKLTQAFDLSNVPNITYALNNRDKEGKGEAVCMSVIQTGSAGEEDRRFEPITYLVYIVDLCIENVVAA